MKRAGCMQHPGQMREGTTTRRGYEMYPNRVNSVRLWVSQSSPRQTGTQLFTFPSPSWVPSNLLSPGTCACLGSQRLLRPP